MANSPQGRASFFDDDDLNIKFEWVKIEKSPYSDILHQQPLQRDNLIRTQANSQQAVPGFFMLYPRCIVQFKVALTVLALIFFCNLKSNVAKQPEAVLEVANSKMKILPESNGLFGFSVLKNGNTYEFTCKDQSIMQRWIAELKAICVLTTFHEEYKAIKMIGRGSFAKVYLVENKTTNKSYAVKAFTKESIIISNKSNAKVVSFSIFSARLSPCLSSPAVPFGLTSYLSQV